MRVIFVPVYCSTSVIMYSCASDENNIAVKSNNAPTATIVEADKYPNNQRDNHVNTKDSTGISDCVPQVKSMFAWANANIDTISSCRFVGINADSTHRIILFKNTKRYLDFLRSSKYFSDKFLNRQSLIYNNVNKDFAKETQILEYLPEDMSYNIISMSNEPDEDFKDSKLFEYKVKNDLIYVKEKFNTLVYKVDNQCKIDSIYRK